MSIVSGCIQKLLSNANLTALLAYHPRNAGSHAIYANVPAVGTNQPYIVIRDADGEAVKSLQSSDLGLADALLDIGVSAEEAQGYGTGEAIKEQIRQTLVNAKGDTWGTVRVSSCSLSTLRDTDFPPPENANEWVQLVGWQASVWYQRTPIMA